MRKFILALMTSLLSCSAASAFWPEATVSSLEIGVGYRNDSVKWKRDLSHGCSCDYNSGYSYSGGSECDEELKWKDLNIWLIEARGKYVTCDNVYLRGSIDYGWITSGKLKHRPGFGFDCCDCFDGGDYYDFSSNRNKHVKGNVWDGKLAVGYQFRWCDECLAIAPVVGYSWHGQEYRHGKHDCSYDYSGYYFSDYSSCSYDYSSSSSYDYSSGGGRHKITQRWNGPFIGFDLDYRFCCDWNFFLGYEYHWADYHATEHGRDFRFFNDTFNQNGYYGGFDNYRKTHLHAKDASGNVLDFGVEWDLCDCWTIGLRAEFQWWYARHPHERTRVYEECIADNCHNFEVERIYKNRLKDVTLNSGSIILDFGMVF